MRKPLQLAAEEELRLRVGQNLVILRTALGVRQMDWVRQYPELLTSCGKLANWETGYALASPLFLIRLCEDTGLSLDWFYRRRWDTVTEEALALLDAAPKPNASNGRALPAAWPRFRSSTGGRADSPADT